MWQENKGVIIALVVGVLIGYAAGASWSGRSGGAVAANKSISPTETSGQLAAVSGSSDLSASSESLMVKDQSAGSQVTVAMVKTDKPTWVAVREDADGKAGGSIMGATLLPLAGEHQDVMVDLILPSTKETKYHVNLYADDGDRKFDNMKDELLKDDVTFSTQ